MSANNCICFTCKKPFHMKKSQLERYKRNLGVFCSASCASVAKRSLYAGVKNPNFKGRNLDEDGYRIYVPNAGRIGSENYLGRMKLHQAVCCELLGIKKMPKGIHIHHRDCDVLNNEPWNLAVMNVSDHKWLHKQYGNATLWALMHGKVDFDDVVTWSDNQARAELLLLSCIQGQSTLAKYLGSGALITKAIEMKPVKVEFVEVESANN